MTARPALELADVFRRHGEAYIQANAGHLGRIERRVIGAVVACRTSALGGHVERCDECGLTRIAYDSCRNRHCPKCQAAARAEWLAARQAELLPVPYFHVVFTLPPAAAEIAFQNKQTVYGLLMRAAAQALMTLAAERLGAKIGLIAVLHSWGQTLTHHPHVHCLVPGGGVALDGQRWVACKPNFLLSVRALSKTFRRLFLDGLEAAFRRGELGFFGDLVPLADVAAFAERVRALRQSSFVVYAKPPFGGPERVLAYLARYTHRTAIANSRLAAAADNEVAFSYKDYRRGRRSGVMRLAPHEFIRRFLLHVLPDGFHRIRHYGFLAKGDRGETLARVRHLLQVEPPSEPDVAARNPQADQGAREPSAVCPDCGGLMRRIGHVAESPATAFRCDTS
ncbi:MAG TPA: IS91 family transposase [Roseiarcus sp.]|nr:IS91 family transposase [Roseiarcus sp.]